jgi:hypothetical protein
MLGACGKVIIVTLLSLFVSIVSVYADEPQSGDSRLLPDSIYMNIMRDGSISLGYVSYFINSSSLLKSTGQNAKQLQDLNRFVQTLLGDTLIQFKRVEFVGSASAEGPRDGNSKLALDRARTLCDYLDKQYRLSDLMPVLVSEIPEDWEGLRKMVSSTSLTEFPDRDEVLNIIDLKGITNDRREVLLRQLNEGKAFRYLVSSIFPFQRYASANMVCNLKHLPYSERPDSVIANRLLSSEEADAFVRDTSILYVPVLLPKKEVVFAKNVIDSLLKRAYNPDTVHIMVRDTVIVEKQIFVTVTKVEPSLLVAVKTNLLFDVALIPNIAVEVALPGRWSAEVEGEFAWWKTANNKRNYYRIQTGGLEVRKWLGKNKPALRGHFFGLYAKAGTYDVKIKEERGYQSDFSFSTGISYGYSARLSRRLNLEMGLSVGYVGGKYDKYTYDTANDRYPWEGTYRLNYFGLTKAKVSLVYKFGKQKY